MLIIGQHKRFEMQLNRQDFYNQENEIILIPHCNILLFSLKSFCVYYVITDYVLRILSRYQTGVFNIFSHFLSLL